VVDARRPKPLQFHEGRVTKHVGFVVLSGHCAMIVKKKSKPRKSSKAKKPRATDWREALRRHLSKVPEVDAVFVNKENNTIHVYSVMKELNDDFYEELIKQENKVEKAFRTLPLEFHACAHQGRAPHYAVPFDAERVFER
jgi:hypothetical protein